MEPKVKKWKLQDKDLWCRKWRKENHKIKIYDAESEEKKIKKLQSIAIVYQ